MALEEIKNPKSKLSNLKKATNNAVEYALNLPQLWVSGDIQEKKRIQKIIPSRIRYNYEKHLYRTECVNTLLHAIPFLQKDFTENKNGTSSENQNLSHFVPEAGLEPALQWNTSLSRARLPIPPLGQYFKSLGNLNWCANLLIF